MVELLEDSPARQQGLASSDMILQLNGHPTADTRQLMEAFQGERWKGQVELVVVRDQKERKLRIKR